MFYEKHKIFLYKEDFDKFTDGLKEAVCYIDNGENGIKSAPVIKERRIDESHESLTTEEFTNIDFDDLGKR